MRGEDRRGTSFMTALITLIVFIAVFLVIALFMTDTLFSSKRSFSDKECQASLMWTRAVDKPLALACVKPIDNPTPIKCSRQFLTVGRDTVLDTTVRDTAFSRGDRNVTRTYLAMDLATEGTARTADPQAIPKRVLAQELQHCWSLFLEGETVVFQQVDQTWDIENNERACFICSEVTLTTPVNDFKAYLKGTEMPLTGKRLAEATPITYYDFIAGNPKAYCNPQRERFGESSDPPLSCWETFGLGYVSREDLSPPWYSYITNPVAGPAIDLTGMIINWLSTPMPPISQDSFEPGTYAVVFLREGMETQACEGRGEEDYTPTLTVQILPADKIGTYCPMVIT